MIGSHGNGKKSARKEAENSKTAEVPNGSPPPPRKKFSKTYLKNVKPVPHVSSFKDRMTAQKALEKTLGAMRGRHHQEVMTARAAPPSMQCEERGRRMGERDRGQEMLTHRSRCSPRRSLSMERPIRVASLSPPPGVSLVRVEEPELPKQPEEHSEPTEAEVLCSNGFKPCPPFEAKQALNASDYKIIVKQEPYLLSYVAREAAYAAAANARKYKHPNILHSTMGYYHGDETAIRYEWCDGCSVGTIVKAKLEVSEESALCILRGALKALRYLHSKGVCHGQLNLDNMYLMSDLRITVGGLTKLLPCTPENVAVDMQAVFSILSILTPTSQSLHNQLGAATPAALLASPSMSAIVGDTSLKPILVAVHLALKNADPAVPFEDTFKRN